MQTGTEWTQCADTSRSEPPCPPSTEWHHSRTLHHVHSTYYRRYYSEGPGRWGRGTRISAGPRLVPIFHMLKCSRSTTQIFQKKVFSKVVVARHWPDGAYHSPQKIYGGSSGVVKLHMYICLESAVSVPSPLDNFQFNGHCEQYL